MTQEEKINYFQTAASICNFGFSDQQVDLLVNIYDLVLAKKGNTDLESIVNIKVANKENFKTQENE